MNSLIYKYKYMNKYRVSAKINLPLISYAKKPPKDGSPFPEEIGWRSAVENSPIKYTDTEFIVILSKETQKLLSVKAPSMQELVNLDSFITANNINEVMSKFEPTLEVFISNLQIQYQLPIYIYNLEVEDITDPIQVGVEKEILTFVQGYRLPKDRITLPTNDILPAVFPAVAGTNPNLNKKELTILKWYTNSLSFNADADRFICLWICLEQLSNEYKSEILAPLKTICNHEISECPICGKSIKKETQGIKFVEYLKKELHINEDISKDLWEARQIVHGASYKGKNGFDKVLAELHKGILRKVKEILHLKDTDPPIISNQENTIIIPTFWLTGRHVVTVEYLEELNSILAFTK